MLGSSGNPTVATTAKPPFDFPSEADAGPTRVEGEVCAVVEDHLLGSFEEDVLVAALVQSVGEVRQDDRAAFAQPGRGRVNADWEAIFGV